MTISQADLKRLWGNSASRCAWPGCEKLLTPTAAQGTDFILGEMAHIVGREPTAPRADPAVGVDDSYGNLILLCPDHHTEADRAPNDYPAELLLGWKSNWEASVRGRFRRRVSVDAASQVEIRTWAYFNFGQVLSQYSARVVGGFPKQLPLLQAAGIVNSEGFPLRGPEFPEEAQSIFETWPQDKADSLQRFYSELVEYILETVTPVTLEERWNIDQLASSLEPGDVVFTNRGFSFKTIRNINAREERLARSIGMRKGKGIELQFLVDTWNMFSNSAVTVHFRGKSSVAALLLVRSVMRPNVDALEIKATPIALGTGFWKL